MKKLVILMFAFIFVMTGCSKTYNDTIKEPDVNDLMIQLKLIGEQNWKN